MEESEFFTYQEKNRFHTELFDQSTDKHDRVFHLSSFEPRLLHHHTLVLLLFDHAHLMMNKALHSFSITPAPSRVTVANQFNLERSECYDDRILLLELDLNLLNLFNSLDGSFQVHRGIKF